MNEPLELLNHKLESLHSDVNDIKLGLEKLSNAVVQLALVEERLSTSQESLGRAFKAIERIEGRLLTLETSQPRSTAMANRIENAIWALGAIVAIVVLKRAGLV